MLKYVLYAAACIILICLIAGGIHLCKNYFKNKKEMEKYSEKTEIAKSPGKVLVVYYSLSGNTKKIAEIIKEKTDADIYEIKTKEKMPSGPKLYMASKKQIKDGKYPELAGDMPDFASYDLIFVGAPIWWYTAATPVLSFLEQADFKGKRVAPFSTQGSNIGTYIEDFKAKAKNAVIIKDEKFNNLSEKYDSAVDNKIAAWINNITGQGQ